MTRHHERVVQGDWVMDYTRTLSALAMSTVSLLALSAASPAVAGGVLPSGGQVVAGQAAIGTVPGGVTINQSSNHAIINWQNFSVGSGNTVQFNNGSGATLNRVTGSNISQINGVLSATGSVYLINPQGVVVGAGGKVITGGSFIASTRDVDNNSFMNGDPLHAKGSSSGAVINKGTINSAYGDTILIGQSVSNSGKITAKKGTAALVAGDDVTLRPLSGDARISVSAGKGDVTNTGIIAAAQAELNAAGGNVYAVAGSGGISATGTRTINGHVWLTAGGDAELSGSVTATSKSGDGGTVTVRAQNIVASGSINASATKAGAAGGNVSIIAASTATVKGAIRATGGQGGKGGFVETSGAHLQVADGATVATNAAGGSNGTWLIDPNDYTIAASGGDISGATLSSNLVTTDVTIATATDGTAGGNGDIFVNDTVSWTSSHVLTLNAERNITVNAGMSLAAGSLVLNASAGALAINNTISVTGAGAVTLSTAVDTATYGSNYPLASLSFGTGGSVDFGSTNNSATLSINGASYTLIYSLSGFSSAGLSSSNAHAALATSLSGGSYSAYINMQNGTLEGLGHVLDGVTFNAGSNSTGLVANGYGTIRDIGITNATVTGGSTANGGIAGQFSGAIINSYFTGTLSVPGGAYVGGLVGYLSSGGSFILNSWTNATVSGGSSGGAGGLAGYVNSSFGGPPVIQNSHALGSVTGGRAVGGAVGILSYGNLTNVYATGNVTDTSTSAASAAYAGGLVGEYDSGAITNAYATGNVSGGYNSGGLVGYAQSAISLSYATGDVVGGGASGSSVGGLIGATSSTFAIDQVASYGSVSGGYYAGGLIGYKRGGIALSNALSAGSATGSYAVGGLIGDDDAGGYGGQSLSTSLSTGAVSGGTYRGGAVGYTQNETFTDIYFTSDTTGTTATVGNYAGFTGITALTTATAQNGSLPGSLSSSFWGSQSGALPYLKTFFPSGVQVLSGTAVNANGASFSVADGGYRQGKGSVGANGYFYVAMQPGSVTTGDTIVLYNSMVNPGGIITTAPASLTGLSYTGGILIASTSATTATAADTGINAQAATVLTHDAIGAAVLASVTDHGYIASGTSFDLNESFTGPVYVQTTTASAPLTVSGTITATGAITLSTTGTLTINAPITASGQVTAVLAAGADAYSQADLVFGTTGKLDFGATNLSSTLSVNSTNYSLLYTMANLVSTAGSGTFALATGITSGSYSNSVLATLNSGALFEGLGNTVTGLTITNTAVPSNNGLGLIGINNGTIRDVRLAGLNITGGNTGTASANVGGLVGLNNKLIVNSSTAGLMKGDSGSSVGGLVGYNNGATAKIVNSSSSATITLPGTSNWPISYAGGLVGQNFTSADITGSWATGNVTGAANTNSSAGGLAGTNNSTISNSYATGNVSSGGSAGGLAGGSQNGSLQNVHATGTVTGTGSATNVGGLLGYNTNTISVTNAYATGDVTGASNGYSQNTGGLIGYNNAPLTGVYATGNVTNGGNIGGLVGYNTGGAATISNAYATGNVTVIGGSTSTNSVGGLVGTNLSGGSVRLSFATGNAYADAAYSVGGLVGQNYGNLTNTYATGSVTNSASSAGGLAGYMASGTITTSYATGRVSGLYMGGLTGTGGTSIVNSYFDSQTTGQANPTPFTSSTTGALTTAAFQNGSLPSGFDSGIWSTGSGLYPYITSFFPGGVQAVSGNAGSGSRAALYVGGTAVSSASVGANGYYYFALPNGIISNSGSLSLVTLDTSGALLTTLTGQTSGLNLASGGLYYTTAGSSLAATYVADRATLLSYAGTPGFIAGLETRLTVTAAIFSFNTPLTLSGGLTVTAPNASVLYVPSPIIAGGPVTMTAANALVVGNAITAPTVLLRAETVELDPSAKITTSQTGDSLQLVASRAFTDASGSSDTLSSAGRWLVYSASPDTDNFGSIDSANTAVWNAHYGDTINQSGNRYVFSTQPSATVSIGTPATKTYGDSFSFDGSYLTATGLNAGVSGVYLADTVTSLFAILPTLTSAGTAVTANVGSYDVTLSGGTAANGYAITLSNVTPGTLTVNQRNLTVTGDAYTRHYGDANAATITAAGDHLVNGDTISTVDITSPTATATSDVGTYAYTAANAAFASGSAGNYNITYANSALNVTVRPVTVTADAQTKIYGDANPALTFTSSSLGAGTAIAGALTVAADATTDVGSYAIGQGTVDNAHNTNYDITYSGANLGITARPVTVTADAQTRYYGDANPTLTFTSTSLGSGTALLGALTTAASATSDVNSYAITAGTLTTANNPNYTISYVGANLGVTARPITVTGDLISRYYGDVTVTTGTGSVTLGSLVNGDTISSIDVLSPTASATSDVGNAYSYTTGNAAFSAGVASNYAITYADGALHVAARPVTVTADAQTRYYGDANPTLTFTNSSLGAGAALAGALDTVAGGTTAVGSYAISAGTVTTANNPNYAVTYVGANLAVTARPITVTGDLVTRDYGDANPATATGTITLGNLVNGDTLSTIDLVSATASATSNVGNSYTYGAGNAAFSAGAASNYAITYADGALHVAPRAVTVTADAQSRYYGDANPTLTFTSTSLGAGAALQGSLVTPASVTSDVGSYAVTQGTLTTANNSNYVVSYSGANLGVTARPITLTGDLVSRYYGDSNPTTGTGSVTLGTLVNGDTISAVDVLSATADGTSNVGNGYSYAIGNAAFSSGNAGNYAVSYVDGALHVTARPITVTGDLITRDYGDANPTGASGTVIGGNLVNGDAISGVGVVSSTATAASDVGNGYSYAAGSAVFSSGAASNYAIIYADGALHVTARAVTVTADSQTRIYGDTNPALTFTSTSLGAGAALQGALTTLATASSDVGSYAITQGTLTTANNSNYTISYAGANLGITPRAVTVTADAKSRIYGDANPALTFTSTSLGAGTALTGALTTPANGASGIGAYGITAGTVTTTNNPNYVVNYVGADLDVTARPLTVTADAISRLYGDANPALTQTVSGLVNGDTMTGALTTVADATSHVGSYAINQGSLVASANYTIVFNPGTLSVNARPVTVTADAASRLYGDANPALTFTTSSLGAGTALTGSLATTATAASDVGSYAITGGSLLTANSDYAITYNGAALTIAARPVTVMADSASRIYGDANPVFTFTSSSLGAGAALQGSLVTPASVTSDVGSYAITQGSLTGANNPNYVITFTGANLAITPRALAITANDLSRIYGAANPALTQTVSGLVNGDTVTGTAATNAGASSNVGSYAITQGSLAASANYTVSFTGGTLTITPALLTVTAADARKTYGDSASLTGFLASGLLNSDSISSVVLTSAGTGIGANAGSYAIQAGSANGSGLGNYTISYQQGTLSVTPRALTITASDLSRLYGAANPALTQTVSGLVNGDTVTGAPATSAVIASNVGSYAITIGSLAAGANYAVTFVPGTLTITPAPLTIAADDISAQTAALAKPTATLTGLVAGDTSAVVSGLQFALVPVDGSATAYTVVPSGAVARNYTIAYVNGQLTVVPTNPTTDFIAPIIVTGALPPMVSVVTGTPPASHVTLPDTGAGTGTGAGDGGNGDGGDGNDKKQARAASGGFIRASLR
jgi:filamentous hemagglutinin family protein